MDIIDLYGSFQTYSWKGNPIPNIYKWVKARNEKMIRYERTKIVPDIDSGKMNKEVEQGEMPESFFNSLLVSDGSIYREIGKYSPD